MLRLVTKTKISPEEAVVKAKQYFGTELGLKAEEQSPTCVYFEGGGGGVEVTAYIEDKQTSVEMVSREWDYQTKEFASKIG
jgi:hypothetical protein